MSGAPWPEVDEEFTRRYRVGKHRVTYRCPACHQHWYDPRGLKRHMGRLHHFCRFCTKAYINVEHHEKRSHTIEYALAAGACENRP